MNARKLTLTTLATLCALAGVLALASAPASAFLRHEYVSQITGTPEGAFKNVCGFTIDPASQDLYVADFGSNAIDIFEPAGAGGYTYKSHISGPSGFFQPEANECDVVVSDVTGDTYVVGQAPDVYVFGSSGSYLETINGSTAPSEPGIGAAFFGSIHVAVDQSSGDIYIADSYLKNTEPLQGFVDKFNKKNEYESQVTTPDAHSLAVDSHGVLYVGEPDEHRIQEFNSSGGEVRELTGIEAASIAVDGEGNLYVVSPYAVPPGHNRVVDEYSSSGALEGQTTGTPTQHFALPRAVVNATGDLYVFANSALDIFGLNVLVPDVTTEAPPKVTGTTATLNGTVNPDGTHITSCEFEYGPTTAYGQTAPCEHTPEGNSSLAVSANLSGLPAGSALHYRLVAANASGANSGEDQAFFTLGPRVQEVSFSEVGLHRATVEAQINPEGLPTTYVIEYGTSEAYGSVTAPVSVGAGTGLVAVAQTLERSIEGVLQAETTYHFRIVATSQAGTTIGADVTFTTLSAFTGLPDGRGYELVSPLANADGNVYVPEAGIVGSGPIGHTQEASPLPVRASADGSAVQYVADPLTTGGSGNRGVQSGNQYVAVHESGGGWRSVDLETAGLNRTPFEALLPDELVNSGTSSVPAGSHRLVKNEEGLFDLSGGRSLPVSVLPDGTHATNASWATGIAHVISADGSRIFWTDTVGRIYVRENDARTVPVSVGAATYWTASPDGRYAFYTENGELSRFDVENETREALAGAGAAVKGVIGVNETGEDGAYIYFVAGGTLAPGATLEGDNLYLRHDGVTTFIATLSVADEDMGFAYNGFEVGVFAKYGDWVPGFGERTAKPTPDGHSLVFVSEAPLTRYDSKGVPEVYVYDADSGRLVCASCQPSEAAPTKVVPSAGSMLPSGSPFGGAPFQHRWISDDGSRVFFDSLEALVGGDTNGVQDVYEWEREGANSCQVKLPARQDGGCVSLLSGGTSIDRSYLLDASASGDDVFVITRAQLVPQDQGETYELYDVRVGAVQRLAEPACTGTGCQGLPSAPPLFATPSSATFNGVGNFLPTPPVAVKPTKKAVKCAKPKKLSHGKCLKKPKAKKSIHRKRSK
jgi:hypothetical protein